MMPVGKPFYFALGHLREFWPYSPGVRPDIDALLSTTASLPGEAIVQVTDSTAKMLVDDEGRLQQFTTPAAVSSAVSPVIQISKVPGRMS